MGVKVSVGSGVEVAGGLGKTFARAPPGVVGTLEAADVISATGVLVANGEGIGCEVQALTKTIASTMEITGSFMSAIIAEAAGCVNTTKTGASDQKSASMFDMTLPVC